MKVKKGVTRIVFIFRRSVWKVPNITHRWVHFLKGLVGNINEMETYRYNTGRYDRGNGHLLCPVLWCSWGGWILIMRRADLITEEEFLQLPPAATDQHRLHFRGDDTSANYGRIDGRLVKIDYAELDDHWGEDFKPADE